MEGYFMGMPIDQKTLDIINEFLDEKCRGGKAQNTLYSYKNTLINFFNFIKKPVVMINDEDVLLWLTTQYENRKPSTRNNRISIMSSFFKF